jgi:4-hydroxy-3-methylbut-2-enyl diphosphate reductase
MKITLAHSAGFCSGVKRAIDIALATARSGKNVSMLGEIVHNETVVDMIKRAGIKKISSLKKGKNHILLIRAHGAGADVIRQAAKLGYSVVDATCPMVKEIHRIARAMESKGFTIAVIGEKKHDEVRGIIGQLRHKGIVIENIAHIPWTRLSRCRKVCVVCQSTQNSKKVEAIVELLKGRIPKIAFYNTICRPTKIKQAEMQSLPRQNDVMIIIGSKHSANTKRLYELSRAVNKKSYWVNSKDAIDPRWFKGASHVGVTAGASTPEQTIKEIVAFLSALS